MKTQSRIKAKTGRLLAAFVISAALGGAAQAQTDSTPPSAAQSLSCLRLPSAALSYPAKHRFDRSHGLMRLRLHFEKPDAAPRVEVLANTAREDMQDRVYRYVDDYRLPCLRPEDGTVSAVQEFNFSNSAMEELPVPETPQRRLPFCLVMPREDMRAPMSLSQQVQHVVASALFSGTGDQPPEVKILHSTGDRRIEEAVIERVQSYRLPCRTGQQEPQVMRQQFTFVPAGHRRFVLKQDAFSLVDFLSMTQGAQQLKAFFDFDTMNCPFKVNYTMYSPALPNEVAVGGKRDPNRIPFLRWLRERQLAFSSERQANELFGQKVQIQVPCGRLDLQPDTAAAGS
ncbi:hypothetical protein ACS5PK_18980 [Roseateles sp. DB2]|uniref:hypothetical protein n=1 Tax=Roseateles sp. DB2 TaxID=3453717 RepID=UPI003EEEDA7B